MKWEKFGLVLLVFTLQCLALVYFFFLFQKKDNQNLFAVFSLAFIFVFNMTYNLSINMKSPKPERILGFNLITIIICNHWIIGLWTLRGVGELIDVDLKGFKVRCHYKYINPNCPDDDDAWIKYLNQIDHVNQQYSTRNGWFHIKESEVLHTIHTGSSYVIIIKRIFMPSNWYIETHYTFCNHNTSR